jgi:hypothetical protein
MVHEGKAVIVRKDFDGGKHQGMVCCEYQDAESGDQKLIWVDARELRRYILKGVN